MCYGEWLKKGLEKTSHYCVEYESQFNESELEAIWQRPKEVDEVGEQQTSNEVIWNL